jgi:AcrR family transcriptional regulator
LLQRRTQKVRREKTRSELLDATVRVLGEAGCVGCTFAVVAKEANRTTGAVQHHFGTKSDLLWAVLEERLLPVLTMDPPADQKDQSLSSRCTALIEWGWRIFGNPAYPVVWEIILGARDDTLLQRRLAAWQHEAFELAVDHGQEVFRDIPVDRRDVEALTHFCSSQLRGLALYWPFRHDPRFYEEQLKMLSAAVEQLVAAKIKVRAGESRN